MSPPAPRPADLIADFPPLGGSGRSVVVQLLQGSELFREYQQAFEGATGLPLVLREAGSFRPPLEGSKRANPFCTLMSQASPTCAACLQLQQRVEEEAKGEAATLKCYAGLTESAVPVRVGDQVMGYLQTGQVFLNQPTRRRFNALARTLPGTAADAARSKWETAYFQTRVVDKKQYQLILRLLAVFAEHLGSVSNRLFIGHTRADTPLIAKTRAFIAAHHAGPLSVRDVARVVHVSPCYFSRLFKGATGQTFTGYLARVRIEAAKEMLLDADRRISEAAYASGFQSLSQFNRQFHRVTGESPSCYRDRLHGRKGRAIRHSRPAPVVRSGQLPRPIRRPLPHAPSVMVQCG